MQKSGTSRTISTLIITQSPDDIDQLEIFGEREYIETSKPKSMPGEEVNRWLMWERQNMK